MELRHNHEDAAERSDACPACASLDLREMQPTQELSPEDLALFAPDQEIPTAGRPAVEGPATAEPANASAELPTAGRPAVAVGQTAMLPIDEILDDPTDNIARGCATVVTNSPSLQKFAASLKEEGQQHPVRVRLIENPSGPQRYRLIFGFRRLASARLLGWKEIEAKVVEADDKKAALMNWAEGNRLDATNYERAMGMWHCKRIGIEPAVISTVLKLDLADVESLIRIVERCPKELVNTFRNDSSPKTLRLLEKISILDGGSDTESRRMMIDAWAEERAKEMEKANAPPKSHKRRGMSNAPPPTMSAMQINKLRNELVEANEWYDPLINDYMPINEEMRAFGEALLRTFRKSAKITLR